MVGRSGITISPPPVTFAVWNALFVLQYAGILDPIYVSEAVTRLAEEQGVDPAVLPTLSALPNGEPFNFVEFAQAHRFPRDGNPTFEQLVADKVTVAVVFFMRLLGGGGAGP